MPLIRWQSTVDFLVLAAAIYVLLRWARQARAVRIALAILGLNSGALLARNYDLTITSWVLSTAGLLAVAVLLVVFQPELRHTFMRLDAVMRSGWSDRGKAEPARRAIAEAAFSLAGQRIGALIVLVRRASIAELIQGGTRLGAEVTRELLEAIFQKTSPLHDGAAIVDGNSITRAGAVLPLTQRSDVPEFYGTRHRAAMGLADRSDALVIAVSEERGTVTLIEDARSLSVPGPEELAEALQASGSGIAREQAGARAPRLDQQPAAQAGCGRPRRRPVGPGPLHRRNDGAHGYRPGRLQQRPGGHEPRLAVRPRCGRPTPRQSLQHGRRVPWPPGRDPRFEGLSTRSAHGEHPAERPGASPGIRFERASPPTVSVRRLVCAFHR